MYNKYQIFNGIIFKNQGVIVIKKSVTVDRAPLNDCIEIISANLIMKKITIDSSETLSRRR
ncbi:hypothetical protein BAGA_22025 [Bacillus gaemokensis]|uniref:Uncharacterized protein n=1 Tax=Bacillus gaemokensis TaxID=574375 RepID=A0A073K6A8_9BACI|nr:hypothetical protein BAGA_22025 [Bacillus gaemokensis]